MIDQYRFAISEKKAYRLADVQVQLNWLITKTRSSLNVRTNSHLTLTLITRPPFCIT